MSMAAPAEEQGDTMQDGQRQVIVETAEAAAGVDAGDAGIAEAQTAKHPAVGGARDGSATTDPPAHLLPPALAPYSPAGGSQRPEGTRAGFLARPFGAVIAALVAVCCFALIGITYSVTVLTGADWTRGAQGAADVAFALALLALAAGALRYYAPFGRRAFGVLGLALLLGILLAGTGAAGLTVAPGLHRTQARVLEQSGRYKAAISEYALAGDTAPNAPDTARAYDEWAASLLRQKQYPAALSRYLLVTSTYPGTGDPYHQAEAGVFATYTAWIGANGAGVPYSDAIAYIQSYSASPTCDATCQSTAAAILPQAAYQFGMQLIAAGQYAEAIKQLAEVKAQYPQSQYATQTHTAAAVAYLDLGQQQLPTACGAAVKSYQTLAKQYADTPQGAQAKQALAAPQPVTGTISHVPSNPTPTIYLSRTVNYAGYGYSFSNDLHTGVDTQSGAFSFASVPVGTYFLSAVRDTGAGTQTVWWNASNGSIYTVNVSPLCGAHLPTLSYT